MSSSTYADVIRHVWSCCLREPGIFAALVVFRVLSSLLDSATPFAAGHLVDTVTNVRDPDLGPALAALALLLSIVVAFQALRGGLDFLLVRFALAAMARLASEAFAQVQRFSSDWHAETFAGATVRKITRGMWAFDDFVDNVIFNLAPAAVVVCVISGMLLARWPVLGGLVAVEIVAYVALSIRLAVAWVGPAGRAAQAYDSRLGAYLADAIGSNAVVKAFAAEPREDRHFARLIRLWQSRLRIAWGRSVTTGMVQSAVLTSMQATMLGTGIVLWSRGLASPGDLATLVATQFVIAGYLRDIGQHFRNAQQALHDMEDIATFGKMKPQVADAPHARRLEVAAGAIRFDEVSFGYAGSSRRLYERLSLEIPAGQRIGLVGASGAGKSTFVKLLQRLYDLDEGRILIDGHDIAEVTRASLRRAIGVVPQDAVLFHRSLAANIAYGRPDAGPAAVRKAAALAHADRFIERLPNAYRTPVGERGVKLSGGERQRVAIARAILAATPILVLDEATSSLDPVSEALVRDAIEHLSTGRTTIVVAHRLSTVQNLDRILVFESGRIVEDGTHADLVARPQGVYRRLFEASVGDDLVLV
jgi:ATP-binding cassette subfamily B protein